MSKLPPYPVSFLQLFLQLLEVEEVQQKISLGEQQSQKQEQKSQKVENIYQALKIRACSSEE